MASVYTDFATSQLAALSDISQAPNFRDYGGTLRVLRVSKTGYTAATADPLYIARLQKGSKVIPALCSIDYGDPGDACTGSVGHIYDDGTGDDNGIAASLALGGSAGYKLFSAYAGADALAPVKLADDAWIYCTWATVTNGVSHTQTWTIVYVLD